MIKERLQNQMKKNSVVKCSCDSEFLQLVRTAAARHHVLISDFIVYTLMQSPDLFRNATERRKFERRVYGKSGLPCLLDESPKPDLVTKAA